MQEILAFWDSTDLKHLRTYTLKGVRSALSLHS